MKGLLIKDFQLVKNQGKSLLVVALVIAVFLEISGMDSGFSIGYITLIVSIFASTTISYDEYENCFSFLLTLPASRKDYVNEKYIFSAFMVLGAWIIGMAFGIVFGVIRGEEILTLEWFAMCISYMAVAAVFVSVMLPLRLKFEGEKGRVVLPLVIAAAGILIYGGVKLADLADIDLMKAAVDVMNRIGAAGIMGMLIAVPLIVAAISWLCSWHILRKKEF